VGEAASMMLVKEKGREGKGKRKAGIEEGINDERVWHLFH
jgi:hypothetical protein